MKYVLDVHTHTIASGHAFNTWLENAEFAHKKGLKLLGTTDHGPAMPGSTHIFYFNGIKSLPRKYKGMTILRGCEANIIDYDGKFDIPDKILKNLDVVIASLHDVCINPGTVEENTNAFLKAMDNPNVCILGHIGNPAFPIDYEKVVLKAKEKNILIEINNGSFISRKGSYENCLKVAELCKKNNVKVILGSDSHICFNIGNFEKAQKVLDDVEMPNELVINRDEKRLIRFLHEKDKLMDVRL